MMGVYINMEMPSSCFDCPLGISVNFGVLCCPTHTIISDDNLFDADGRELRRQDWCPLAEIPPHGRLIDADALLERFEKEEKAADEHGRDFSFSFKSGGENCTEWWPVQQMLMDAPTIIPAEEGET